MSKVSLVPNNEQINQLKEMDKKYKRDEMWRKKIMKELHEIVVEDWGDEPEGWDENDERYQVWKAFNIINKFYK